MDHVTKMTSTSRKLHTTLQVVNPSTGEIAAQFPEEMLALAIEACDKFAKKDGSYWAVVAFTTVYERNRPLK